MNIDATAVDMTSDSPILSDDLAVNIALELTTMNGQTYEIKANEDFDRLPLFLPSPEKPATLADLIAFIIRRRHPVIEYIADRNGVRVIEYRERLSFRQAMASITYHVDSPSQNTPF